MVIVLAIGGGIAYLLKMQIKLAVVRLKSCKPYLLFFLKSLSDENTWCIFHV